MKPQTYLIFLILLITGVATSFAQKDYNIWYFGTFAGLDFNSGVPVPIGNGQLNTAEGTSSVCDPITGALLFYTDGVTVWNRNHTVMANGTGLLGNSSSTQSALIVPMPGNPGRYYIFTNAAFEAGGYANVGTNYSTVEMSQSGGLGSVVQKNVALLTPSTEKIAAILTCSGSYWIVLHRYGTNDFLAYLLNSTGISATPVVSSVGPAINTMPGVLGYMMPSPEGRHLAMTTFSQKETVLFDFDQLTGVVSNPQTFNTTDIGYGLCFSPDGSKLYMAAHSPSLVLQYDISSNNLATIIASRTVLQNTATEQPGGIQIGPDRQLYMGRFLSPWFAVIRNPNLAGLACGYVHNGLAISPGSSMFGIPTFPYLFVGVGGGDSLRARFFLSDTTVCAGNCITIRDSSRGSVSSKWYMAGSTKDSVIGRSPRSICYNDPGTYTVQLIVENSCRRDTALRTVHVLPVNTLIARFALSDTMICPGWCVTVSDSSINTEKWKWVLSGSANDTVIGRNPGSICYKLPGTYTVRLIATNPCSWDTVERTIVVIPPPTITAGNDTTLCSGDTITLQASGGVSYRWETPDGLSCTDCPNPVAHPTEKTTYVIRGFNALGCSALDSITVDLLAVDAGGDTMICASQSAQLHSNGSGRRFLWSPAAGLSCTTCSDPIAQPTSTTIYRVENWNDSNSCHAVDSVNVTVAPLPVVDAGPDRNLCVGDSTQLITSGDAVAWRWSPSIGLDCDSCSNPVARPLSTTTYHVVVTNASGCTAFDSVTITSRPAPSVRAGFNRVVCAGDSIHLHGYGNGTLRWSPADGLDCTDCSDPIARPAVTTTYRLTVTNSEGCTATDTVLVSIRTTAAIDAGDEATICRGDSTLLMPDAADSYLWSPSVGLSCNDCRNPVASPTATTTYHLLARFGVSCSAVDSVTVNVLPSPLADAGPDRSICPGESVALTASGGASYRWMPSPDLSCTDCANPTVRPTTTTTYHLLVTNDIGCTATDSVTVRVGGSLSVDLGPDVSLCGAQGIALHAKGYDAGAGYLFVWSPANGLSCTDCPTPLANPTTTTSYTVEITSPGGCKGSDMITVVVRNPTEMRAHIPNSLNVFPGARTSVPIVVENIPVGESISDLDIVLNYNTGMLRLDSMSLVGTRCANWNVVATAPDAKNGKVSMRITAPVGSSLPDSGTIMRAHFLSFLGSSITSDLPFSIDAVGNPCLRVAATPGHIQLDSICGLGWRLMEAMSENFALDQNIPNPFNATTEINFSIGLDGPVRLSIYAMSGEEVARLVDEPLGVGRYRIGWNAGDYPSGVYYCRLQTVSWSSSRFVVLLK
jgi:PKD repeat protein